METTDVHRYPLFRALFPLLAGLLTGSWFAFPLPEWALMGILLLLAFPFRDQNRGWSLRGWKGSIRFFIALFLAGILLSSIDEQRSTDHWLDKGFSGVIRAEVVRVPVIGPRSVSVVLELRSRKKAERIEACPGKVMAYLEKEERAMALLPGDALFFKGIPESFPPPAAPSGFDYGAYMEGKGIGHRLYLPAKAWVVTTKGGWSISRSVAEWRQAAEERLEACLLNEKDRAIASALLLGKKDALDQELKVDFAGAGAMHVLAVSGLHVGIIYLVLATFLNCIFPQRKGKWPKAFLLLACLWSYALLTGSAASVLRASTMFSFVIIGQTLQRRPHIYNTLSGSALLWLIIAPRSVFDVGFQFSYLAVFGIVTFHPRIDSWVVSRYSWVERAWSLVGVSLAAQLATFPLGAFYFHQFPNYFLLTNFLVIPLATLILYAGGLVFMTFSLPVAGKWSAVVLEQTIRVFREGVGLIESWPGSTWKGLYPGVEQVIFLYGAVIFLALFLDRPRGKYLAGILASVVLVLLACAVRVDRKWQREALVVYAMKEGMAFDLIRGDEHCFIAEQPVLDDPKALEYGLHPFWEREGLPFQKGVPWQSLYHQGLSDTISLELYSRGNYLQFGKLRVMVVHTNRSNGPLPVDVLVIGEGRGWQKAIRTSSPEVVVITVSTPREKIPAIMRVAGRKDVLVHDSSKEGAFVHSF